MTDYIHSLAQDLLPEYFESLQNMPALSIPATKVGITVSHIKIKVDVPISLEGYYESDLKDAIIKAWYTIPGVCEVELGGHKHVAYLTLDMDDLKDYSWGALSEIIFKKTLAISTMNLLYKDAIGSKK